MELVDVPDSKSGVGNYVSVRPRPSADKRGWLLVILFYLMGKWGELTFVGSTSRAEARPSKARESRSTRRRECRFPTQVQAVPFNARRSVNNRLLLNVSKYKHPDYRQIKEDDIWSSSFEFVEKVCNLVYEILHPLNWCWVQNDVFFFYLPRHLEENNNFAPKISIILRHLEPDIILEAKDLFYLMSSWALAKDL